MRSAQSRFVCVTFVAASLIGAALSLPAATAVQNGGPFSISLQEDAKMIPPLRPNSAAALLKTFERPVAETSLNKHKVLGFQDGAPLEVVAETSKVGSLDNVETTPVPEPTALFLAGLAGCMLLATFQRLRGSKPQAY